MTQRLSQTDGETHGNLVVALAGFALLNSIGPSTEASDEVKNQKTVKRSVDIRFINHSVAAQGMDLAVHGLACQCQKSWSVHGTRTDIYTVALNSVATLIRAS